MRQNCDVAKVYANIGAIAKATRFVLQSAILGIGAYLVIIEQASGGVMIASSIMMGRALAPIEVALANWKQLVAARQGIERLRNIMATVVPPAAAAVDLPRPKLSLSIEDVTVAVPGSERVVLSNISFQLTAGTGLALLGPSAAGKSSLVRALVGIWPAAKGTFASMAPRWTSGIRTNSAAISAICRKTSRCLTAPLRKISRGSMTGNIRCRT